MDSNTNPFNKLFVYNIIDAKDDIEEVFINFINHFIFLFNA